MYFVKNVYYLHAFKKNFVKQMLSPLSSEWTIVRTTDVKHYHQSRTSSLFQLSLSMKSFNNQLTVNLIRNYAKGKDKIKEKSRDKGIKFARIAFTDEELNEFFNVEQLNNQMRKSIDTLQDDFIKNLSLRSTTGAIETLKILIDGREHQLQELAQIIRKNPKTIVINMIGFPQTIPLVIQTLHKSGMNLNPQQDGTTIFIPVPKVTKEHREHLAKNAKTLFIKCRDAIKDAQNKTIKKIKNKTDLSKDDSFSVQNQIVSIGDRYIVEAEKLLAVKQKELIGDKD